MRTDEKKNLMEGELGGGHGKEGKVHQAFSAT